MWYWVKVKKVEWTVGRSVALVHLVPNFDLFFVGLLAVREVRVKVEWMDGQLACSVTQQYWYVLL